MEKQVRLRLSSSELNLEIYEAIFPHEDSHVKVLDGWGDYTYTTLRDIAIVMRNMCGHGVYKQLARSLSSKLHFNYKDVLNALDETFEYYSEMSEEDAEKEWDNLSI